MFSLLFQTTRDIRRNFKFDFLAAVFFGLFFGGINSFLLVQARRLGATPLEVGFLAAVPNIWMLLSPIWAKRFEEKCPFKTVLFADGISRFFLFFLLVNKSAHWYLFIFTLHYFFSSITTTVYGKAMSQAYPAEIRGTLMGWARVGLSLTMIISTAVAGILLPWLGVQRLFALLTVFGICSSLAFGRIKQVIFESPKKASNTGNKVSALKVFQSDLEYRRYMIAMFLFGLAITVSLPAYPLYQVDILRVSDGFISMFWMIIAFSSLIFYFIAGQWIDRYSPLKLSLFVFIANLGVPLLYFLAANQWPLLLVAVLQGIVNAGVDLAAINSVLSMAKEGKINSYMAVHIYLIGLRGTIGPLLAPFLIQLLTFRGFFLLILLLNLAGIWLLRPLLRQTQSTIRNDESLPVGGAQ